MKSKTANMDSIATLTIRLLIITICAGLILGLVYSITKEPIARQAQITADESRRSVLPDGETFEQMDISALVADNTDFGEIQEVYRGEDAAGETAGYTMSVVTTGYSPNLSLTVGIDDAGVVTGVDITSHEETPGLGANATSPDFLGQYVGADGPLAVVKTPTGTTGEVQALTGATITSRAVTGAVNLARDFFQACLAQGA